MAALLNDDDVLDTYLGTWCLEKDLVAAARAQLHV